MCACIVVSKASAALSETAPKVLILAILLLCYNRKIDTAEVASQQPYMMLRCHVSLAMYCNACAPFPLDCRSLAQLSSAPVRVL